MTRTASRTIKYFRQLIGVLALAVEGAADRREGFGERKNVGRNQQVAIFRSHRMPVHTLSRNRDFRHQIGSADGDTCAGNSPQRDAAYDPVFARNLFLVEK